MDPQFPSPHSGFANPIGFFELTPQSDSFPSGLLKNTAVSHVLTILLQKLTGSTADPSITAESEADIALLFNVHDLSSSTGEIEAGGRQ